MLWLRSLNWEYSKVSSICLWFVFPQLPPNVTLGAVYVHQLINCEEYLICSYHIGWRSRLYLAIIYRLPLSHVLIERFQDIINQVLNCLLLLLYVGWVLQDSATSKVSFQVYPLLKRLVKEYYFLRSFMFELLANKLEFLWIF